MKLPLTKWDCNKFYQNLPVTVGDNKISAWLCDSINFFSDGYVLQRANQFEVNKNTIRKRQEKRQL